MAEGLEQTLASLRGGVDEIWWRNLLTQLEHEYVTPNFLRKPAVQEWLALSEVQTALLRLAQDNVMGRSTEDEQQIRERLADRYSERTGEASRFAQDAIDVVIACLTAGYVASIPRDQQPLAGMIQDSHRDVVGGLKSIEGTLREGFGGPIVGELLEGSVERALSEILQQRMFDYSAAARRARQLWDRVDIGDWSAAPARVKDSVCYWAARLLAADADTVAESRQIRERLPAGYTGGNLCVVDALICSSEGDGDRALRLLRNEDHPEARSLLVGLLRSLKGAEEAVQWCEHEFLHPGTTPEALADFGWRNWAVAQAQLGRWEEAAAGLKALALESEWSAVLGMWEGVVNAALLLPEESRGAVFEGLPTYIGIEASVGDQAKEHHARAAECFEHVTRNLPTGAENAREEVEGWKAWLKLMDPDAQNVERAEMEVCKALEAGGRNGHTVTLAWAFGIPFDDEALRRDLDRRRRIGGHTDEDVLVECLLNQISMSPPAFAEFVDGRLERLDRVIPQSVVTAMLFGALVEDGQVERARRVLESRQEHIDRDTVARMEAALQAKEGVDPRKGLEERYEASGNLIDLRNLIGHLQELGDYRALRPHVLELFAKVPTLRNGIDVVQALSLPEPDHRLVVEFLGGHPALVQQSDSMKSALARGQFHLGQVDAARTINDGLRQSRRHRNDLSLDVNIAMATGDWEQLASIVGREWPRREEHDAHTVMALARIASQVGQSDRAETLARTAAQMAPQDPRVLTREALNWRCESPVLGCRR
ncbi:MAG: hypothetical protein F4Y26_12565, partial [Gammaproteobacteria bacterium]|nr:hypothetical protein [Gammaproteobacteria bacterium]